MQIFRDILNFLYPLRCDVCGRLLGDREKILCLHCYLGLPRTNFHQDPENPVAQLFWGRIRINHAAAYFFFNKGGSFRKLIHKLKYNGREDIGIELGRLYANELRNTAFSDAEIIMPVPLHPIRFKKRGYNQSERIAEGMASVFRASLISDNLYRSVATGTQTRKNRFERFLNMEGKFDLHKPDEVLGKKILLVDDVVTTGSTLEACADVLIRAGCSDIFVLTLAVA